MSRGIGVILADLVLFRLHENTPFVAKQRKLSSQRLQQNQSIHLLALRRPRVCRISGTAYLGVRSPGLAHCQSLGSAFLLVRFGQVVSSW